MTDQITKSASNGLLSAHQPTFLPWIGLFLKISQADVFVFSDDVKYSKQSLMSSVRFLDNEGKEKKWSISVTRSQGKRFFEKQICRVNEKIFLSGHRAFLQSVSRESYAFEVENITANIVENFYNEKFLSEFNISVITYICQILRIECNFLRGSALGLQRFSSNERLLKRAEILGNMSYLYGQGASGYQDNEFLTRNGMKLKVVDYSPLNNFGEDASYSILHLIAKFGIEKVSNVLCIPK